VAIQAGGSRRPFFFLHGQWQGGGFFCYPLARAVGPERPFYSVEPYRFDGLTVPPRFEAIAAEHLRSVRAVRPRGPYALGGWCNGGLLAYEMARQLRAAGEEVDLLVMMDPVGLVYPRYLRVAHRLVREVGDALRVGRGRQLDWLLRVRHAYRLPGQVWSVVRSPDHTVRGGSWEFGRSDYPGVYDWVAMDYRPADRFTGRSVFLLSAGQPFRRGWRDHEAAGGAEVHVLRCTHATCLGERLDELGEHLSRALAAVP
jgi:thioesterase domain-containing protein